MKKTKVIYLALVLFIVAVFLALPFITIPISVSSGGTVRPMEENILVTSVVSGRVIKSALHTNNQKVDKGDTLLVVTSDALHNKTSHQQELHKDFSMQLADLRKLTNKNYNSLSTGQYQLELSSMREKIAEIQSQITLAEKDFSRAELLWKDGVIPQSEYDQSYHQFERLRVQKNAIEQEQLAQWQIKMRETERQLQSIVSEVEQLKIEKENHVVLAPTQGRLVNFSGIAIGAYLIQGQKIADISGEDRLIAECMVPTSAVGLIKINQPVKLQIHTYNYNQWGLAEAVVTDIDNHLRINEQTGESFFSVKCKLNQTYLQLKNGYKGEITKGQTFTARFYLLDRTLWQLIFDKVDDWFNPNLSNS